VGGIKKKFFFEGPPGGKAAGCFCVNVYLKGEFSSNQEQNEKK